jgi:hypothetical protein
MDESANEGAGEREPLGPNAAQAPANQAAAPKSAAAKQPQAKPHQAAGAADNGKDDDDRLPVVWSPKLDAGDDIATEPAQAEADDEPWSFAHGFEHEAMKDEQSANGASAQSSRSLRFALLAASLAVAAAVGSFAGTHWMLGVGHSADRAVGAKAEIADANTVQALKAQIAELNALKASLDASTRGSSAQIGKLADRLDRLEHAQAEPTAKLAHISDAIDRLEKRTAALPAAAPETTGSIATNPPPPPAAQAAGAATTDAKLPSNVLHEWVVQGVQNGRALVENRYGGMFDVAMGSILPGLGRVDAIKRQDGEWIVVTPRGLITSTGR